MYICKYCGKEFDSSNKLGGHASKCKENPNYKQNIENWKISYKNNLDNHKNNIEFNKEQQCFCKYCNKEHKTLNSLVNHERFCKENPNRQESPFIKYNKDTTKKHSNNYIKAKELGLPKPEMSEETKQKIGKIWKGKSLPEEMKLKISISHKKYLEEHPDKVPFKLNHSSKKSYPEQYFEELFNNENIPLKYHKQVGRYELDFYNEDLMKYVEIDGDQHNSEYMIKHDKERDLYLENLGWKGIRIKWSEYKKMNLEDKQNKIIEIRLFMGE